MFKRVPNTKIQSEIVEELEEVKDDLEYLLLVQERSLYFLSSNYKKYKVEVDSLTAQKASLEDIINALVSGNVALLSVFINALIEVDYKLHKVKRNLNKYSLANQFRKETLVQQINDSIENVELKVERVSNYEDYIFINGLILVM